jgi:hypothetical protein
MVSPIIAAIVTLFISGVILLVYLRYQHKLPRGSNLKLKEWPKGLKRLHRHTSHKVVTTFDRDEAWEIDGPVTDRRSFVNFAPSSDNARGQPLPVQSFYDMEMTDIHELDKNSKTVSSLKSTTEKAPTRSRLPWKRKPPHITLVPASSNFRVDDDKNNFTLSAIGRKEINVPVVRELPEDVDHVPQEIEETRSLITPSERAERDSQEVILISKDGRSFTLDSTSQNTFSINSQIKVISPSGSSTSPQSAMYSSSSKVSCSFIFRQLIILYVVQCISSDITAST